MDIYEIVKRLLLFEKEIIKNPYIHRTILGFMHNKENEIGYKNLVAINSNSNCNAHLDLLQESTKLLYEIIMTYKHKNEDELALLGLGIRIFNDILSSFKLMISGYYQISLSIQRDLLETGFLLDDLAGDKGPITEWRTCTREERLNKYSPKKVRDRLDKRDGFKTKKRAKTYHMFCEYASHPTHVGSKIIAKDGLAETGSFHDEKKLKNTLYELTKMADHAVAHFIAHFEFESKELTTLVETHIAKARKWMSKYV
jgi:hypothetical protein